MENNNSLCANCGRNELNHPWGKLYTNNGYSDIDGCKKFKPVQSPEIKRCKVILINKHRNCNSPVKQGSNYCARHSKLWDKTRGIFDTAELQKEIINQELDYFNVISTKEISDWAKKVINERMGVIYRKLIEERLRLKADVEKAIDEWFEDLDLKHHTRNADGFISHKSAMKFKEELKTRLGISQKKQEARENE